VCWSRNEDGKFNVRGLVKTAGDAWELSRGDGRNLIDNSTVSVCVAVWDAVFGSLDRQFRHPKTPSISTFLAGHLYLSKSTALPQYTECIPLWHSWSARSDRSAPGIQDSGHPVQRSKNGKN